MNEDVKYLVTTVDRFGDLEVRKTTEYLQDAESYKKTVPRERMPEIWAKIGDRECESNIK